MGSKAKDRVETATRFRGETTVPSDGIMAFGRHQLSVLAQLLSLARELTAEFYKLGQQEATQFPVEVRTVVDQDEFEIRSDEVLAYIARYGVESKRFGRLRDLYRINLQDHNILESLGRRGEDLSFSPLLLYVLTHELIHVIRFVKFLTPFHQDDLKRLEEEERVHQLTHRILSRVPMPGLTEVLAKYRHLAG